MWSFRLSALRLTQSYIDKTCLEICFVALMASKSKAKGHWFNSRLLLRISSLSKVMRFFIFLSILPIDCHAHHFSTYDGFLIGAQTTSAATCLKVSVSEYSAKNIKYRETRPTIQPKEGKGNKWGCLPDPGFGWLGHEKLFWDSWKHHKMSHHIWSI